MRASAEGGWKEERAKADRRASTAARDALRAMRSTLPAARMIAFMLLACGRLEIRVPLPLR